MLYAGSIPVACKFFTSEISKKLNIPFDRAEIFKIRFGNEILCSKDKIEIDVTETLKSALDIWESEVKNNLVEFYKFFDKKLKPKEIILSGGSSHLKDIHARLKIIFNCPVKNINTFERIKLGHDIREKSKQINEYFFANCVGMSICNTFNIPIAINLLPREIRIKRLITYRYAYVAAFLLTIIFGVITEKYLSPFLFSSKKGQNKNISIPSEQSSYSKSVPGYFKKFKKKKKFNDIIVSSIKVLPEKTYLVLK
ncbi:hypothetical protein HY745_03840 [Candidatus Desantisbacteria bacterium]|nr:hypothetical protein [Candidatus Desantisbacteria bacterium]